MSLEDQVARLANAIGMHDDVAVREIIRQRDVAQKEVEDYRRQCDSWMDSHTRSEERRWKLERKNAALRGVITRMKRGKP